MAWPNIPWPEASWPNWDQLAELIKATATALWPVVIFGLIWTFRKELRGLVSGRKLKKGKLFGQEFELDNDLNQLNQSTKDLAEAPLVSPVATPTTTTQPPPPALTDVQQQVFDVTRQVLAEAGTSPKAALMTLAAQMEAELRTLVQLAGGQVGTRTAFRDSLQWLRKLGVSDSLLESMLLFRDIRNKIIHGYDAADDDVLRAIDSGLRILHALGDVRRERDDRRQQQTP